MGNETRSKNNKSVSFNEMNLRKNEQRKKLDYTNPIYHERDGIIYNLLKSAKLNFTYFTFSMLSSVVIGYMNNSITRGLFTMFIYNFWAYIIHYLFHFTPFWSIFHGLHHTTGIGHKWWAEVIETFVNIFGSGGLPIALFSMTVEKVWGIKFFLDNYILVLTTFLYTTIHMINYHYLKIPTHLNHHYDTNYNYGPDCMDILFKTKTDGDEFENMNTYTINIIIATIIIVLTMNTRFDIVKNIRYVVDKMLVCFFSFPLFYKLLQLFTQYAPIPVNKSEETII